MVGTLPTNLSNDVSYRGNAFVYEDTAQLGFADLSGGWCTGNEVGKLLSADLCLYNPYQCRRLVAAIIKLSFLRLIRQC